VETYYTRILLKLSGEALAGKRGFGIDSGVMNQIASEIKVVHDTGVEIAIVIGGGNILRGVETAGRGLDRTASDTAGMLATVINSMLFREALRGVGMEARVLSAIKIEKAAEFYVPQRAINHLKNKRVVIIAGGTGNPYFTTDTAAALRCVETQCDVLLKATKVDGIYDSDPKKNPDAVKLDVITHQEALKRNLRIMDATAFSLCMENSIPIIVFKLLEPGNLQKCIEGHPIGSIVKKGE
jgi:uridylate kinase